MRRRRNPIHFIIAVVLVIGLVQGVMAAEPEGKAGKRARPRSVLASNAERLGLSPETLTQIETLTTESRVRARALRKQIRAARTEMKILLAEPDPSYDAVMAKAADIGRIETESSQHTLGTLLKMRALLSPEQRAELERITHEERERRGKGPRHAVKRSRDSPPTEPNPATETAPKTTTQDAAPGKSTKPTEDAS